MSSQLKHEFEVILAKCTQNKTWDNKDRSELKQFLEKLGKISEVASALDVSKETLRWWGREEPKKDQLRPPPPAEKLQRCRDLILEQHFRTLLKTPDSPGPAATTLYDVFLRLRDFNEILQRAKLADKLWAFRFGRPFRAGIDQQVFEATVQFVLDHPETDLFFVYREPDLDDPEAAIYEAKKSFAAIQFKIDAHPKPSERKALRERIHGIPVRGAEADKLGLVDPWVAYAAAEYSDRGYAEYKRAIDVWVETLFEDVEEKRLAWLELPPAEALKWMQRRAKILTDALKRAAAQGAPVTPHQT